MITITWGSTVFWYCCHQILRRLKSNSQITRVTCRQRIHTLRSLSKSQCGISVAELQTFLLAKRLYYTVCSFINNIFLGPNTIKGLKVDVHHRIFLCVPRHITFMCINKIEAMYQTQTWSSFNFNVYTRPLVNFLDWRAYTRKITTQWKSALSKLLGCFLQKSIKP